MADCSFLDWNDENKIHRKTDSRQKQIKEVALPLAGQLFDCCHVQFHVYGHTLHSYLFEKIKSSGLIFVKV
jgi:hypothetical protein